MQVSFTRSLEGDRAHVSLGRIKAMTGWRSADAPVGEKDREMALRALVREAEDFGADAIVAVTFSEETVQSADIGAAPLRRLTASGEAVRFRLAA